MIQQYLGVQYDLESTTTASEIVSQEPSPLNEMPEALALLPAELLQELEFAITQLDSKRIAQVIDVIHDHEHTIASDLSRLAQAFRYRDMLSAVQQAHKHLQKGT
jgi:hypothetical protein